MLPGQFATWGIKAPWPWRRASRGLSTGRKGFTAVAKKIVIIGTGYVGLPLAIVLARAGYQVVGVDIEENVVNAINQGVLRLAEEEVKQIFREPRVRENLHAQKTPCPADVFIISVPTPLDEKKRIADLSQVIGGVESILPFLRSGNLVILESTVPPLTCRQIVAPLIEKTGLKVGESIFLCHCPERILPGEVFEELVNNDRVIGGLNAQAAQMAREIYASFVKGNLYLTDDVTAELVKLMENTYRDVNIALANEFAAVAEGLRVDILQAIELANKHPRVNILKPGIGTGGHCIPVDPWFIKEVNPINSRLIHTARLINDEVPYKIAARIRQTLKEIKNPRIVAVGVTYKPDTYDIRNSPALKIVSLLREDGYQVAAYDPLAQGYQYTSLGEVAKGADCLVILVEHQVVKQELAGKEIDIKKVMRHPLIMRFYPQPEVTT
ncbi:MAG: nucleotide sugar dehydrogenase [Chloroflexi bacterium]|nr:nucleotide sugar dehydrogenase [Chloroflexota bacterium]